MGREETEEIKDKRKKTIKDWELGLWASNVEGISITDRARMVNWICDNWRCVNSSART